MKQQQILYKLRTPINSFEHGSLCNTYQQHGKGKLKTIVFYLNNFCIFTYLLVFINIQFLLYY